LLAIYSLSKIILNEGHDGLGRSDPSRSLPEERAAEIAARTLALPDAPSVEDLTALLT
jgi:hypothetical protein